jgi:protein-tyrosine phosphatase
MPYGPSVPDPSPPLLPSVPNFRDLGGLPTGDGRRTRAGRLYRSSDLSDLTEPDLTRLRALGVATVLDLRTPAEAARTGRGLLSTEPLDYRLLPVTQPEQSPGRSVTADHAADDAADPAARCWTYLETSGEAFTQALRLLGQSESYPLVVQCTFGKDRTGVLAALVLELIGVDRAVIVEDYARSAVPVSQILAAMRRNPVYAETIDRTPPALLSAKSDSMDRFLAELQTQAGGARGWSLGAGLSPEEIDALADQLLDTVPA